MAMSSSFSITSFFFTVFKAYKFPPLYLANTTFPKAPRPNVFNSSKSSREGRSFFSPLLTSSYFFLASLRLTFASSSALALRRACLSSRASYAVASWLTLTPQLFAILSLQVQVGRGQTERTLPAVVVQVYPTLCAHQAPLAHTHPLTVHGAELRQEQLQHPLLAPGKRIEKTIF